MKIGNLEIYGVIYKITNKLNNKNYIGITTRPRGFLDRYSAKGVGIERVYNFYTYQKKNNQFWNKHLYNAIDKYGFDAFEVNEIFDVAFSKEELKTKEECWIGIYKANNITYGYNRTKGGDHFLIGEDNPRYKRVNYECDNCGKEIKLMPKELKEIHKHYCCESCRKEGYTKFNSGENNAGYKKEIIFCDCCGKEIKRSPSTIKTINYCSKECQSNGQGKYMIGRNNPNYGNGIKVSGNKNGRATKVMLLNTMEIFSTLKEGGNKYGINSNYIGQCCIGRQKSAGSIILDDGTEFKLVWMYYNDYIKQHQLLIHNENLGQAI